MTTPPPNATAEETTRCSPSRTKKFTDNDNIHIKIAPVVESSCRAT